MLNDRHAHPVYPQTQTPPSCAPPIYPEKNPKPFTLHSYRSETSQLAAIRTHRTILRKRGLIK
jgi:hypothetical protein